MQLRHAVLPGPIGNTGAAHPGLLQQRARLRINCREHTAVIDHVQHVLVQQR